MSGVWTWGLTHGRQVLYHWTASLCQCLIIFIPYTRQFSWRLPLAVSLHPAGLSLKLLLSWLHLLLRMLYSFYVFQEVLDQPSWKPSVVADGFRMSLPSLDCHIHKEVLMFVPCHMHHLAQCGFSSTYSLIYPYQPLQCETISYPFLGFYWCLPKCWA